MKYTTALLLLLILSLAVSAQKTVISGRVRDAKNGESIPYANIIFKNTHVGTMSTFDGQYSLSTDEKIDQLEISAVGYIKQTFQLKVHQTQKIDVNLSEDVYELGEIVILPTENPAHPIFRNIIKNKANNNPSCYPDWYSKVYNKIEVDLKNIKRRQKDSKIWKQFDFVYDHIDTLETDGKTFLPVFISESISDVYHNAKSGEDREVIVANKASGMTTAMITKFTGQVYQNVNIYDNYIMLSDIGLVSPVCDQGLSFYRYYLTDSAMIGGHKTYELSFKPKLRQEPVFEGKMWVADSSFAITRVEMKLAKNVNVNFLNDVIVTKNFMERNGKWVPYRDYLYADLNIRRKDKGKTVGLIGRKTTHYRDFSFEKMPEQVKKMEAITVEDKAMGKAEDYWLNNRPEQLRKQEAAIYAMVDSVKKIPLFRTVADVVEMFFFGYKDYETFEIGPYYYMYSFNQVEGNRFRFGGRTTGMFSKKFRVGGYLAYGLKDSEFKYGGNFDYYFNTKLLFMLGISGEHDYQLLGKSDNAFMEDNIMSSLLSRNPNSKLNMLDKIELYCEKEWVRGFSNKLTLSVQNMTSGLFVPFIDIDGTPVSHIRNTELSFNTRIAFGETFMAGDFDRTSFGSDYPIVNLKLKAGLNGFMGGEYDYLKVGFDFYDKLPINPLGYSVISLKGEKIFGHVPFPLLGLHPGNETYAFDVFAFNMMNYYEFTSDAYISAYFEHHFQGFFLNKMPLFRRLKWREVVGFRALWGELHEERHTVLQFPEGLSGLGATPYMEASVGIENIFKFFRVDALWRLNYNNNTNAEKWGIRVSMQFIL